MSQKLYKAVIDACRADAVAGGLVELTKDSSDRRHIARRQPIVKERTPFLGIKCGASLPAVGVDVTHLKRTQVEFDCIARKELTAIQIADRVEALLQPESDTGADVNLVYWNFSNTEIRNLQTRWRARDESEYAEDTEVWTIVVAAEVHWVPQPCP